MEDGYRRRMTNRFLLGAVPVTAHRLPQLILQLGGRCKQRESCTKAVVAFVLQTRLWVGVWAQVADGTVDIAKTGICIRVSGLHGGAGATQTDYYPIRDFRPWIATPL